jgi:N-acetylgalactosamine kinase
MNLDEMPCVILAGGRGSRMASVALHKVCFPVAGRPAILRGMEAYGAAGLKRFLIVVGQMAEQVIATVADESPEASFVYQADPRGTGHAALLAVQALKRQGYRGPLMIVMGDKIARPAVVHRLLEHYRQNPCGVLMSSLPAEDSPSSGRVVRDRSGRILGVVEVADIRQARQGRRKIRLGGRQFTARQIEQAGTTANVSMYVFDFDALAEALESLGTDNAQGELYLTDTVEHIASRSGADEMVFTDAEDLMGFNTPAELMAIEEVVRRRERPPRVSAAERKALGRRHLKTAGEWAKVIDSDRPGWNRFLRGCYGRDDALIAARKRAMAELVEGFIRRFGPERKMILCRAPGRVNLMGRHIDHRGGQVNVMATSQEILMAAAPREDDAVSLANLDEKLFPDRQFRIRDLLRETSWADWIDFVDSRTVRDVIDTARGDWSHYARAPLLRLQHENRDIEIRGMDCLVGGNIPRGAGLSSSSALVVVFAEAAVALNGLDVAMQDYIDLCGEGEWFVGSRGGAADHAAIRTSRRGSVSRIGFFPFRLEGDVPVPEDLRLVIAHSGSQAVKSAGARDVFNQRVAAYRIAEMYLAEHWPAAAGMEHLRDLAPERLGVASGAIYRALKRLPERPTREHLREIFPTGSRRERLEQIFSSHADLGPYDLRGVTLFGLSEIARSSRFADLLAGGDLEAIGRYMHTSHDGDRVVRHENGRQVPHAPDLSDSTLERLAAVDADLAEQPGRYACSTEAIDALVDLAEDTGGVVGAQLAGAGLGGCMMILARADALDLLTERLGKEFYRPRKLEPVAEVCAPVAGACLMST